MIDVKNITKSFGSLQVLKGIDLHIDKGEVVSIVGPSGAGKTTLLQIIGTLDRPDNGQVIVDGIDTSKLSTKKLAAGISEDHLFVVVTARKGTISYKNALERLPDELQKHFSGKNLMIIFPDQFGNTKDERMSFTEAQHHEEKSIYDTILRWIDEKRKVKK